ncbi:MAG: hypothetical protein IPH03_03680 [Tetrasphaera sp.]|nr:hypothetical protein [Tetrasphaera sp.]
MRLTDDLIAYQDADYARRFIRHLGEVHRRGSDAAPERAAALTGTVARHLHKLMAYKDEYEVARLSLDPALDDAVRAQFGANAAYAFQLHPPMLRALGVRSKVAVPAEVAKPAFTALYAARRPVGRVWTPSVAPRCVAWSALIEEYVAPSPGPRQP